MSKVADEQSSWLQHLKQTAKGQAESLGVDVMMTMMTMIMMVIMMMIRLLLMKIMMTIMMQT